MSYDSLSHSKGESKYQMVFIPKRREKELYENIRKSLESDFRELAWQKCRKIEAVHMLLDHVHMRIRTSIRI